MLLFFLLYGNKPRSVIAYVKYINIISMLIDEFAYTYVKLEDMLVDVQYFIYKVVNKHY